MAHSKGFKRDTKDYGYRSHRDLIALVPPSLETPNLLPFTKGWIWQDGAGMCVGEALKCAVGQWLEANGHPGEPMISADFAYKAGRAAEHADEDPDRAPPLEDGGSEPGLVLLAARTVGVRLEIHCPDPSTDPALLAEGIEPWSIERINEMPTPDALVEAYDMKGLEFFAITAPPGARKEAFRDCMVRRQPVLFAMFVDSGVENNRGETIAHVNPFDPGGGGHMLCAGDASSDEGLVFCNWWRNDAQEIPWGDKDGRGRVAWDLVERNIVQAFGVKAAPLAPRAA